MSHTRKQVNEWALVLASEGIAHQMARSPNGGWTILVPPSEAERADRSLRAYMEENQEAPVLEPREERPRSDAYAGVAAALLLIPAFIITGGRTERSQAFIQGTADAALIRAGELWRTVTALTLHADLGHIMANTVAGGLFFGLVSRALGPGLGLSLILLSGALGNWINAWAWPPPHRGVGASTMVFGALGILAGRQLICRRRGGATGTRAWAPVVAGALILSLMGFNPDSDIPAHIFGFLVGIPLGAGSAWRWSEPPGWAGQLVWGLMALGLLAGSWWLALA